MKNSAIHEALNPKFERFVTPAIITHVYRLVRIMAALQVSMFLAVILGYREWLGPILVILGFILAPLVWLLVCLITRAILEFLAVVFAIHRELADLAHKPCEEYRDPGNPPMPPPWS
ncbi:DUF4282 domain-containing protein [Spirillospora sp. NBC_00431]